MLKPSITYSKEFLLSYFRGKRTDNNGLDYLEIVAILNASGTAFLLDVQTFSDEVYRYRVGLIGGNWQVNRYLAETGQGKLTATKENNPTQENRPSTLLELQSLSYE